MAKQRPLHDVKIPKLTITCAGELLPVFPSNVSYIHEQFVLSLLSFRPEVLMPLSSGL